MVNTALQSVCYQMTTIATNPDVSVCPLTQAPLLFLVVLVSMCFFVSPLYICVVSSPSPSLGFLLVLFLSFSPSSVLSISCHALCMSTTLNFLRTPSNSVHHRSDYIFTFYLPNYVFFIFEIYSSIFSQYHLFCIHLLL